MADCFLFVGDLHAVEGAFATHAFVQEHSLGGVVSVVGFGSKVCFSHSFYLNDSLHGILLTLIVFIMR